MSNTIPIVRGDIDIGAYGGSLMSTSGIGIDAFADSQMIRIPYADRFRHTLLLGATGCGKTTKMMLPMIRQDLENTRAAMIVIDGGVGYLANQTAKMAAEKNRKVFRFSPYTEDCPFFNPLVGNESDVIINMTRATEQVMRDDPEYFKSLTRQTLRMALLVLLRLDKEHWWTGKYATFENLQHLLSGTERGLELLREFKNIENPEYEYISAWFDDVYLLEGSRVYEDSSGLRAMVSKLNAKLGHILNPDPAKGETNQLDFNKLIADEAVVCISTGRLRAIEYTFMNDIIMSQLKQSIIQRPIGKRGVFVYLDEFHMLASEDFCESLSAYTLADVAVCAAMQSRAQLPANIRKWVDAFMDNIILMCAMPQDAAFYAKRCTSFYHNMAELYGANIEDQTEQFVKKIMSMNREQTFCYLLAGGKRQEPSICVVPANVEEK